MLRLDRCQGRGERIREVEPVWYNAHFPAGSGLVKHAAVRGFGMTSSDWVIIISAVSLGLQQLYKQYLEAARERAAIARDLAVAAKVREVAAVVETKAVEVKTALVLADAKKQAHLSAQDAKLEEIVGALSVVKTQTNGMSSKLEAAAFAAGQRSAPDTPGGGK